MASNLMIDDRLQIDMFNPTTWTGDFGVSTDGFRKDLFIDGSYTTAINEKPTDYGGGEDLTSKPKDLAGNMYLKTISPKYAPHDTFPTRKLEYSNGTVTWYRAGLPWSWMGGQKSQGLFSGKKGRDTLFVLFILVVIFYLLSRIKK